MTVKSNLKLKQDETNFLYSIQELANFLNCSVVTAQNLKNSGKIPFFQYRKKVMFDREKVLKALEHDIK